MDSEISLDCVPTGFLAVNTYILSRQGRAVVVDPGGSPEKILGKIGGGELAAVLLTHAHFDHIGGIDALLDAFPRARFLCHPLAVQRIHDAAANLSDMFGDPLTVRHAAEGLEGEITLAGIAFTVFFVPGHTPDHLCFYVPEKKWLFSGDALFAGGIGRSDFPGGDGELLVRGVKAMLDAVPEDAAVFPGHGGASVAGQEKRGNPYL